MTSAAAEKEINKWSIWGINKLLEVNFPLSLKSGDGPPTLDLAKGIFCKDENDARNLLKYARSSLRDLDLKWVIYGACRYNELWPLKKSIGTGDVDITANDIFRTFGKSIRQGQKYYDEAQRAYELFSSVRRKNLMSLGEFSDKFVPRDLLAYRPTNCVNGEDPKHNQDKSVSFGIILAASIQLYEETPKTAHTLFKLVKHTSQEDYRLSSMGWDDQRKIEEMKDEDMRYLIVRLEGHDDPSPEKQWNKDPEADQSVIGFLSFMITEEEEDEVVYIYEIHISEHFRDCGLGRRLFEIVEHIGRISGMSKSMLTVFKRNEHARKWYASRGYSEDEISPKPRKLRGGRSIEPDYEILSKPLQCSDNKKVRQ